MSPSPPKLVVCTECGLQFTSNDGRDLICEDCEAEIAKAEIDDIVDQKID